MLSIKTHNKVHQFLHFGLRATILARIWKDTKLSAHSPNVYNRKRDDQTALNTKTNKSKVNRLGEIHYVRRCLRIRLLLNKNWNSFVASFGCNLQTRIIKNKLCVKIWLTQILCSCCHKNNKLSRTRTKSFRHRRFQMLLQELFHFPRFPASGFFCSKQKKVWDCE